MKQLITALLITFQFTAILAQDNSNKISEHFNNAKLQMNSLDYAKALSEFENGYKYINPKSSINNEYVNALLFKSKIYSHFEQLDSAEFSILQACGLSLTECKLISDSKRPATKNNLSVIIEKLNKKSYVKDAYGYHIVLSLLYNILGEQDKVKEEQQKTMDLSSDKKTSLDLGLSLYKIRQRKIDVYNKLSFYENQLKSNNDGDIKNIEYQIALQKYYLGWIADSEKIVDKYLVENSSDLKFLELKMNLCMVNGNLNKMKEYEKEITKIDANAFKK